jgi:acyl-CoA dehydrogenase
VVCRTDPTAERGGLSVIMVKTDQPGFKRGRNLHKVGQKSQDTAEIFFENARAPASDIIGEENRGLNLLMAELPFERLLIGLTALGAAKGAYQHTLNYISERKAFGQSIASFQNSRYKMAEMRTEIEVGEAFVDRCVEAHAKGELSTEQASMCKLWLSEMQGRVVDTCVQLHGGYGYMWEYPVGRFFADARVQRIYGGTSEIMKELISRSPELDD